MDEASATGQVAPSSGPLVLGGDGMQRKTNYFAGFLDEVRVWPYALDAAAVAESFAGMPNGDEAAPMTVHYTFNNEAVSGEVTDTSGNGHHAVFAAGQPVYLTSSTPVYMKKVVVTQDTAKTIKLMGADADGDAFDVRVTTFPSHGSLITGGVTIDFVPYKLTDAEVIFVPGPQAAYDTTFSFVVSDGKLFSAVATVVIDMVESPDGPTALPVPPISTFTDVCGSLVGNNRADAPEQGMLPKPWWEDACEAGEKALYQVTLSGYDADGDDIDVDYNPSNVDVFFGYAVQEASGRLTSSEQIVSVMLTPSPETFTLYSGVKGYAVYFDGSDAAVEAPVEATVTSVSVEAWFRSSGALLD
eukprot:scaffold126548_cov47-Prasinocladus_malaysianus.AAC.1